MLSAFPPEKETHFLPLVSYPQLMNGLSGVLVYITCQGKCDASDYGWA